MLRRTNADKGTFDKKPLAVTGEGLEKMLFDPSFFVADERDDRKDGHGNADECHVVHTLFLPRP